jgi:Adenine deaminase
MVVVRDPRPEARELVAAARAALGLEELDLLVRGAYVVDVWARDVKRQDVGVKGRVIACVGSCRGRARRVIDADGLFLAPGFVEAHIHVESSFLSPSEFSRQLVTHGTTAAFVDVHEVGNVMGLRGVAALARAFGAVRLKVFLLAPPNVPPSRKVDDQGGASIPYGEVLEAARGLSGIGEVMDLQSLAEGDEEFLSFAAQASTSFTVQGHMAGLKGPELDAYVSLGIRNDHEVVSPEELEERISRGVFPFVRYGSSWRDLDRLSHLVSRHSPLVSIVADDIHALHLVAEGHLDRALRRALELGVDPVDAVRAVTLAPAMAYGFEAWMGSIAPGRLADMVLLSGLDRGLSVIRTFIDGSEAVCNGAGVDLSALKGTVRVSFTPSLEVRAPVGDGEASARLIELVNGSSLTRERVEGVRVREGRVVASGNVSEVHVINRYGKPRQGSGLLGLAVEGAIASSVSHDTHNVVVVGGDRRSMEAALGAVLSADGGIAVARGGEVRALLPLPLAGLMSDMRAEEVAERLRTVIDELSRACRCDGDVLLHQLQLLSLTVIPELRVTDRGLYSVPRRSYVPLLEVS